MLIQKLQEDLKKAQLERDAVRVSTLRLLISEIKNARIAKGGDLSDPDVVFLIQKEAKKRKESIESFSKGGREVLANRERSELAILEAFLPEQLSSEELGKIIEETINETGAGTVADIGKVMGSVMAKVSGRAEGGVVSTIVKEKLSK